MSKKIRCPNCDSGETRFNRDHILTCYKCDGQYKIEDGKVITVREPASPEVWKVK